MMPWISRWTLTTSPVCLLPIHFLYQFARHLVETRNCVCNTTSRFKMSTHNPVDSESFECGLRTKQTSGIHCDGRQGKRILMSTAAVKASFHEPDDSINLAHSFASFRASSRAPFPTHALLRFTSRLCELARSSDNATVYREMASSYCLALTALSARSSSLLWQRYLKSDKKTATSTSQ